MTDPELARQLGRVEGRLDALERQRQDRDQALDRQLLDISRKLDRLTAAFDMGRGGAVAAAKIGGLLLLLVAAFAWTADRLPGWLR